MFKISETCCLPYTVLKLQCEGLPWYKDNCQLTWRWKAMVQWQLSAHLTVTGHGTVTIVSSPDSDRPWYNDNCQLTWRWKAMVQWQLSAHLTVTGHGTMTIVSSPDGDRTSMWPTVTQGGSLWKDHQKTSPRGHFMNLSLFLICSHCRLSILSHSYCSQPTSTYKWL